MGPHCLRGPGGAAAAWGARARARRDGDVNMVAWVRPEPGRSVAGEPMGAGGWTLSALNDGSS